MDASGASILIVEDDDEINQIMAEYLSSSGCSCTSAYSGTEARSLLFAKDFDVLICDLMLPGLPGQEVVKLARERGVPCLVVSAKSDVSDKIDLLELGAEDYLTKPFDLGELKARVEVQIRRASLPGRDRSVVCVGKWRLDAQARTLHSGGEEVPLTRIEYNIAELLARHPNRVFSRPELFERAWGEMYAADDNTVNAHVSTLRAKLKPTGTDCYLKTVWGVGFKLVPDEGEGQ